MESAQSKPSDLTPINNSISIGPDILSIRQWADNGQKFLSISKYKANGKYSGTFVPEDVLYKFVAAMDEVIRKLPSEELTLPGFLATQFVAVNRHSEFKLSAWHQKGEQWQFAIRSEETKKDSKLLFPFSALPWLREQIIKILPEQDGIELIDKMPKIPEWAIQDAPKTVEQEQVKADNVDLWGQPKTPTPKTPI